MNLRTSEPPKAQPSPDWPGDLPRLALSVRQPWAWAILALGKDVENRSWRTRYRGPVLIHAGKGLRVTDAGDMLATVAQATRRGMPEPEAKLDAAGGFQLDKLRQQTGGIVGVVDIVDCVPRHDSPWFAGPFAFVLRNPRPLPFRACAGALGFFDPFPADRPPEPPVDCPTLF